MKTNLLWIPLVVVAAFGTQAALAQATGKTRDEVKKECAEARKAGTIKEGECSYDMPEKSKSNTTRAEVKKEATTARKAGAIKEGECAYDMPEKGKSNTTRAAVKADCAAARKAGTVTEGEAKP